MDYCSSCRRYLNGALVCPGCGAYAPDIAPDVTTSGVTTQEIAPDLITSRIAVTAPTGPAREPVTGMAAQPPTDWLRRFDQPPPGEPEPEAADVPPRADGFGNPADDFQNPVPSGEGRAARRRQRARWKKNQRRAVVATAVALVGGGLTISAMNRHSGARPQAATAPDTQRITLTGELPDQTQSVTATPTGDATSAAPARKQDRTQGTGTTQRRIVVAPSPTGQATHMDAAAAPRPAVTSAPRQPSAAAPAPAPARTSAPPQQTSTPTPTPTPSAGTTAPSTPPAGSPATTSPSASPSTKPTQLCLLVICLG
jgi:hypothetical protein